MSTNTKEKKYTFKPAQLDRALFRAEDTMNRLLCPYFLLGKCAYDIKHSTPNVDGGQIKAQKIEIGVRKADVTKEVKSMLATLEPTILKTKNGFEFDYEGVPIVIKIIEKDYKFFKYLDTKFYMASEYLLPNPFAEYWKVRNLVK